MNPLKLHTNGMFATRETFDNAMAFAHELINSISDKQSGDKIAALTALMVVVNTASKLWPEATAQSDEPQELFPNMQAVRLAQVQSDLDTRIAALASRVGDLEQSRNPVTDVVVQVIQSEIEAWADEKFNYLVDDWLRNHADIGQEVETWMENNMDIENEVRDVLSNANLSISLP